MSYIRRSSNLSFALVSTCLQDQKRGRPSNLDWSTECLIPKSSSARNSPRWVYVQLLQSRSWVAWFHNPLQTLSLSFQSFLSHGSSTRCLFTLTSLFHTSQWHSLPLLGHFSNSITDFVQSCLCRLWISHARCHGCSSQRVSGKFHIRILPWLASPPQRCFNFQVEAQLCKKQLGRGRRTWLESGVPYAAWSNLSLLQLKSCSLREDWISYRIPRDPASSGLLLDRQGGRDLELSEVSDHLLRLL